MGLQPLDYICIVAYMAFIIGLGSYFARQQRSTKDYFLAGKSMRWLPLSISMYATLFSSISYVMAPAEAFQRDLQYLVSMMMFPVASVLAIILFIDFFTRLRITTVFEYLEARFNAAISLFMLAAYMLYRCLYAGIVVFTLSMVLHITMGLPLGVMIVAVGIGSIIYTTLGGMKAVIWTDVVQFFILVGGILLALYFAISKIPGGIDEVLRIASDADKLRLVNTDFDLTQRYVVWTLIPFGIIDFLGSKSVDQMNVQRYLSARTGFNAKMAMLIQSFFSLPVWLLLFSVGACLFAYYQHFPSAAVQEAIAIGKYDRIFPIYIYETLPAGIRGLLIAALLAAAMSTMDSVLNVLSTISIVNIYKGRINPNVSDRQCLVAAKLVTVFWGVVVIVAAFAMINIESILKTVNSIIGIFIGPLMGVFMLGMFSRRTNSWGAFWGFIAGFTSALYLKFLHPAIFDEQITFTIYGTCGLVMTLSVGYAVSLLFAAPGTNRTEGLLWRWRGWREMLLGGVGESKKPKEEKTKNHR